MPVLFRSGRVTMVPEDSLVTHRKSVRHFHKPGHLHELTFSTYQRRPLLTNDSWLEKLARCVDAAGAELEMNLVAFVLMPEHVHLLVYPRNPEPAISLYIARVKQPFSKQTKPILADELPELVGELTVQERPGKSCFRFWQEGPGFDRNLFTTNAIESSIDYIHNNPVKRGLCRRAVDWKWSSARYYLADPPRQQFSGLPYVHGLPEGAVI